MRVVFAGGAGACAVVRHPHEFSGLMHQRIRLVSVMLMRPRLLIADEPTTALDMLSQREVMDLMVELAWEEGSAVMLITHDLGLVQRYASRAVVMCHADKASSTSGRTSSCTLRITALRQPRVHSSGG